VPEPGRDAVVQVRVTPAAGSNAVGPYRDGWLRVRVTRPPAGGEATLAARKLVARALAVAPSRVTLLSGSRAREKRFSVAGLDAEELGRRLRQLGEVD
jgi:uncharacterized protein YggU (UPF0235/DUF167 family)